MDSNTRWRPGAMAWLASVKAVVGLTQAPESYWLGKKGAVEGARSNKQLVAACEEGGERQGRADVMTAQDAAGRVAQKSRQPAAAGPAETPGGRRTSRGETGDVAVSATGEAGAAGPERSSQSAGASRNGRHTPAEMGAGEAQAAAARALRGGSTSGASDVLPDRLPTPLEAAAAGARGGDARVPPQPLAEQRRTGHRSAQTTTTDAEPRKPRPDPRAREPRSERREARDPRAEARAPRAEARAPREARASLGSSAAPNGNGGSGDVSKGRGGMCRFFALGYCRAGAECRFKHGDTLSGDAAAPGAGGGSELRARGAPRTTRERRSAREGAVVVVKGVEAVAVAEGGPAAHAAAAAAVGPMRALREQLPELAPAGCAPSPAGSAGSVEGREEASSCAPSAAAAASGGGVGAGATKSRTACRYFQQGRCREGEQCLFRHGTARAQPQRHASAQQRLHAPMAGPQEQASAQQQASEALVGLRAKMAGRQEQASAQQQTHDGSSSQVQEASAFAALQAQMADLQASAERQAAEAAQAIAAMQAQVAELRAAQLPRCSVLAPGSAPGVALSASHALMSHPVLGAALRSRLAAQQSSAVAAKAAVVQVQQQQQVPASAPSAVVAAAEMAAKAAVVQQEQEQQQRPREDESLCVVCMDVARSMILLPCSHLVMCEQCCDAVRAANNECPMEGNGGWFYLVRYIRWGKKYDTWVEEAGLIKMPQDAADAEAPSPEGCQGKCKDLFEACEKGDKARVRRCLEHTRPDCMGGEALVAASADGHEAVVRLLLSWPLHTARADCMGGHALVCASAGGHEAVVRLLLASPWHPAHADSWGFEGTEAGQALISAAENGHLPIVRLLLHCPEYSSQSTPRADGSDGREATAIVRARNNGHSDVVCLLESAEAARLQLQREPARVQAQQRADADAAEALRLELQQETTRLARAQAQLRADAVEAEVLRSQLQHETACLAADVQERERADAVAAELLAEEAAARAKSEKEKKKKKSGKKGAAQGQPAAGAESGAADGEAEAQQTAEAPEASAPVEAGPARSAPTAGAVRLDRQVEAEGEAAESRAPGQVAPSSGGASTSGAAAVMPVRLVAPLEAAAAAARGGGGRGPQEPRPAPEAREPSEARATRAESREPCVQRTALGSSAAPGVDGGDGAASTGPERLCRFFTSGKCTFRE
ncbi:hypothetical protein FOA52_012668 [Chlamydomonas sp. UWO 241]|nr:hypothetical protein FOA52_012668 [Chlamydomonas sp. UWO 241]